MNNKTNELLIEAVKQSDIAGIKKALDEGAYIHYNDDKSLVLAIENNDDNTVKFLIENNAYVDANKGMALSHYCEKGNFEMVKKLFNKGAYIHYENDRALREACKKGHYDIAEYLLDNHANINREKPRNTGLEFINNKPDETDKTALVAAIYNGHSAITSLLVERGADIHLCEDLAFMTSSYRGAITDMKFLLKSGADANIHDGYAIVNAAYNGHLDIIKLLVKNGINLESRDNDALKYAFERNHVKVAKYLIDFGIDPVEVIDDDIIKKTIEEGNIEILSLYLNAKEDQVDIAFLVDRACRFNGLEALKLLEEKYDISLTDAFTQKKDSKHERIVNVVPLILALQIQDKKIVNYITHKYPEMLIDSSHYVKNLIKDYSVNQEEVIELLDIMIKNCPDLLNNNEILKTANSSNKEKIVSYLISKNAAFDFEKEGSDLMLLAVVKDNTKLVKQLLEKNVVVSHARDKILIHAAETNASLEMIKLLVENGAPYKYFNFKVIEKLNERYEADRFEKIDYIISQIDSLTPVQFEKLNKILNDDQIIQLKQQMLKKDNKQEREEVTEDIFSL